MTWLNGMEDGLWVIWHENGKKMREVHWRNGKGMENVLNGTRMVSKN